MSPGYRWVPRVERLQVSDPHGTLLMHELDKFRKIGAVKLIARKETFKDTWHIEATFFDREEM